MNSLPLRENLANNRDDTVAALDWAEDVGLGLLFSGSSLPVSRVEMAIRRARDGDALLMAKIFAYALVHHINSVNLDEICVSIPEDDFTTSSSCTGNVILYWSSANGLHVRDSGNIAQMERYLGSKRYKLRDNVVMFSV